MKMQNKAPARKPGGGVSFGPMDLGPSLFEDAAPAFRHESLWGLLKRWCAFRAMGFPRLSGLIQTFAVGQVGHAPGRALVRFIFDLFLGGDDLEACVPVVARLRAYDSDAILDYLVEGEASEAGRDSTLLELTRTMAFASRRGVPFVACKPSGLMDLEVLRKLTLGTALDPDEETRRKAGFARLSELAKLATRLDVRLFVDAEWVYMQAPVDDFMVELMRRENRDRPRIFTTLQMYRKDRLDYLRATLALSRKEGWHFAAKLVRGAYMELERATNPVDPIYPTIEDTHRAYDTAVAEMLDALDHAAVVVATHNPASVLATLEGMRARKIRYSDPRVSFAQLLGMSDPLTFQAAGLGCRSYKYVPYGPVQEAVPYLVRRAQENTAIERESTRELEFVARELRRRLGLR